MEAFAMDVPTPDVLDSGDFCDLVLSQFSSSEQENDQNLCSVIGSISQVLREQNQPCSPAAYLGAISSSLDSLASESNPSPHTVDALVTLLSLLLPHIPLPLFRRYKESLSTTVPKVLRLNSATADALAAAVKCVSHLLMIENSANFANDVEPLYGALVGFIADSRQKVRKQAHASVRDVLQRFQGKSLLAPASDGITKMLERFLLLTDTSGTEHSEEGAQQVLLVLDALKDCLPLMSPKSATEILKYYERLLGFRLPAITKRITDSLNVLCRYPSVDVSAEALLKLLSLLASASETSVDNITVTARLLDVGMQKVYALNRQICVVKLPSVFSALKDIMEMEHEEAIFAAKEAFKSLIQNCIDDDLIKQGVDQIKMYTRKSQPTVIEKLCATVESLLTYQFFAVWDVAFQVVSAMFDKLGFYSQDYPSYFMNGTLKSLAEMEKLSDDDFPYRKQLHECLGSAIGAMGPEAFLSVLPLRLEAHDLSEVNVWLFPIVKQYTVGAQLSFFTKTILGRISAMRQRSCELEREGLIVSARSVDALAYKLWSLLPSFCNYPLDTAESFMDMGEALCTALREEPDVRAILCSALQNLVQQNKRIREGFNEPADVEGGIAKQRALNNYTPEVAKHNLSVLRSFSGKLLPILSGILIDSANDDGGCLQSTISDFASIAAEDEKTRIVVSKGFSKTMKMLRKATQHAAERSRSSNDMLVDDSTVEKSPSIERARLFDLAASLLCPGLKEEEVAVLFNAVQPALKDTEGSVQKKAYKVLSKILQNGFLSSSLDTLHETMIELQPFCHFSATRHRLECLQYLIAYVSKKYFDQRRHGILGSFLHEIVLALKEANGKTRNKAYDLLVQIGHAFGDEESGGKRENMCQFFNMVAGGLAGKTPHTVSAAVRGLARLAYEFPGLITSVYQLLPSTFLLLQRKNREIIKASMSLLKVLVRKSLADELQMHLESIVEGLMGWQDDKSKSHSKAKVKVILEMLVNKCGLEAVKRVMPEEHMKLLTNIRKTKERREKKLLATKSEETKSRLSGATTTSRLSRWNHTRIFSDSGDEETEDSDVDMKTVLSGRRSKALSQLKSKVSTLRSKQRKHILDKSLSEDLFNQLEDEPLDLLDRNKTRASLRRSSELGKRKHEVEDDEPEIDPEGRLIIHDEGEEPKKVRNSSAAEDSEAKSEARGSRLSRATQKRRKTSSESSGWAYTGNEYTNKKAGGDVKRKGKLEPYAYWPLDRKMMSRRPEHRAAARRGMSSVVRHTKKLEGKSASAALSMKMGKVRGQKTGFKRKSGL